MVYLTRHTHACLVDNQLVFLDLRGDRYVCLDPNNSDSARCLFALSVRGSGPCDHGTAWEPGGIARLLLDRDLITLQQNQGREFSPPPRSALVEDLVGYHVGQTPTIRSGHVLRILSAAVHTALRLRWLPLHMVIGRAERRRRRWKNALPNGAGGWASSHQLVEIFNRLRPLLFSAKNQCLYDSLVLTEFLAGYQSFPTCVIGVRMGPFAAHCWVEEDGVVFNDSVAKVAAFTPIMAF